MHTVQGWAHASETALVSATNECLNSFYFLILQFQVHVQVNIPASGSSHDRLSNPPLA